MTKTVVAYLAVGLIVGVIVGYIVGYTIYQPQVSQLQDDLSDTQSALSTSQSLATSLQGQLTEAQANISLLETQLVDAQNTVASLETQLAQAESQYSVLSSEYSQFRSNVTSMTDSLKKKLDLEREIIKMWIHYERLELTEMTTTLFGLETYVDAIEDTELSTIWDEFLTHFNAGEYAEADAKLADLMERNSALIQSGLEDLDTLLENFADHVV